MTNRPPGRLSLRIDSAYCALTAFIVAAFAVPLARQLAVPVALIVVVAVATGGWAFVLYRVAARASLRGWLWRVMVANVLAAVLIGALAVVRPLDAIAVLLAAVAVEVAGFAASQALALRHRGAGG